MQKRINLFLKSAENLHCKKSFIKQITGVNFTLNF